MTQLVWVEFGDSREMASAASLLVERTLAEAITRRGAALAALPGGTTPDDLYEGLSGSPAVDWKRVTIIPLDERLLPRGHPDATLTKLLRHFGDSGAAIPPLVDDRHMSNCHQAARAAERRLSRLSWPLDLACLGIGEDGHTASILAGPDLESALFDLPHRRVVGVRPRPLPHEGAADRVTLTGCTIAQAALTMIILKGERKRKVLERAVAERANGATPIGRLLKVIDAPVRAFWCPG